MPEWTIVSGGQQDRLNATANAYAKAGAKVLHTATDGAVRLSIDLERLSIDAWRVPPP